MQGTEGNAVVPCVGMKDNQINTMLKAALIAASCASGSCLH